MGVFDTCQTDYDIYSKLRILSLFWSHSWKSNINANEMLTTKSKACNWETLKNYEHLNYLGSSDR